MNIKQSFAESEQNESGFLRNLNRDTPFLIYKIDSGGNIVFTDGSLASKFDMSTDIVGKNVSDVFAIPFSDYLESVSGKVARLLSMVMIENKLVVLKHYVFRSTINGLFPDCYSEDGFFCYAVDVTEDGDTEKGNIGSIARMDMEILELKAQIKAKDKMFAVISHDLRAPINSILGLMKLIDSKELPVSELVDNSKEIISQLTPLSTLIDNLFRSATASFTGNEHLRVRELVNVYDIVQQNIGFLHYAAEKKKIHIVNQLDKVVKIWAVADQIEVIFRNVIANAIKFTPFNGVIVISAVIKKGIVEFAVADTGIGMSIEQLNDLFSVNKKVTLGTDNERGTGLGLLITKEYVLENGGEIKVTSELSKGTVFKIIFSNNLKGNRPNLNSEIDTNK